MTGMQYQTVIDQIESHARRAKLILSSNDVNFFETNPALKFDRALTKGFRLNIAAGTAVRFEPGQDRDVELVEIAGAKTVYGFRGEVMGKV